MHVPGSNSLKRLGSSLSLLLILSILGLAALGINQVVESTTLLTILNGIFITAASLVTTGISSIAFLKVGLWRYLALGTGALVFGVAAILSGPLMRSYGPNTTITIYDIGVFIAAVCYALGAINLGPSSLSGRISPKRPVTLALALVLVLGLMALMSILSIYGKTPVFFVQGVGSTPLRVVVLGVAIVLFGGASIYIFRDYLETRTNFSYWLSLGLLSISAGFVAVFVSTSSGTPLVWAGRAAQYVGNVYLLIAAVISVQRSRSRAMPTEDIVATLFQEPGFNYRFIMEANPSGVVLLNEQGKILLWSHTAGGLFGYTAEEANGLSLAHLIFPDHIPFVEQMLVSLGGNAVDQRNSATADLVGKSKNGVTLPVQLSLAGRKTNQGWVSVAVLSDITERKRAEDEIKGLNKALVLRAAEIQAANQNLEERVRARTAELTEEVAQRQKAEERVTRLNSVLGTLRNVNQLIVHEKDRERLIQRSCGLLAGTPGYRLAWILLVDETKRFRSLAVAGVEKDVITGLVEQFQRGEYLQCAREVLSEEGSFLACDEVEKRHQGCPLVDYHVGGAGFTGRLEHDGRIYGTISVDVPRGSVMDAEEQGLFRELAGDISFALANIEGEEKRKQAEENERVAAERYRKTLDGMLEGGQIIGYDWRYLYVNDTACRHGRRTREELVGHTMMEMYPGIENTEMFAQLRRCMERRLPHHMENEFTHPDGTKSWFELSIKPVPEGIFILSLDITEQKKMQQQLIVQDRLASIGKLASGIAHELNNPLTGILGLSELVLDADVPAQARADLKTIHQEARRTTRIVQGLLTFARKQPEEKYPVDINDTISKVLQLRAYEQKVSNINVTTRFAPALPPVMANDFQLQQVFLNLIINAEYFMLEAHGRGNLAVTTGRAGDVVRASFTDDGPGVKKGVMEHLFTPFFTTKEMGKGTGLGLSICHGIVSEHGGRIYAESEAGKGATFVVELPILTTSNGGE